MNLNSVMIGTEDVQRLAEYYTELFGKPRFDDGGFVGWQLGQGGLMIGPHDQVKGKNASPGRLIVNIETTDVDGDFGKLKAAGGIVVQEPYTPGDGSQDMPDMRIATFADPDDNYFQLVTPMPEDF